jgi:hypothetical protein
MNWYPGGWKAGKISNAVIVEWKGLNRRMVVAKMTSNSLKEKTIRK